MCANEQIEKPKADIRATWTTYADYLKQRLTLVGVLLGLALLKDVLGSNCEGLVKWILTSLLVMLVGTAYCDLQALSWVQRIFRAIDDPVRAREQDRLAADAEPIPGRQKKAMVFALCGMWLLVIALGLLALVIGIRIWTPVEMDTKNIVDRTFKMASEYSRIENPDWWIEGVGDESGGKVWKYRLYEGRTRSHHLVWMDEAGKFHGYERASP